jgi:vacuolar-type H+-ATPase subunit I/STV1
VKSVRAAVVVEKQKDKMAKWFRSEPMEYISLIMNEDAAHDCLADLGKLGVIQFTDVRLLLRRFRSPVDIYITHPTSIILLNLSTVKSRVDPLPTPLRLIRQAL